MIAPWVLERKTGGCAAGTVGCARGANSPAFIGSGQLGALVLGGGDPGVDPGAGGRRWRSGGGDSGSWGGPGGGENALGCAFRWAGQLFPCCPVPLRSVQIQSQVLGGSPNLGDLEI